MRAPRPGLLCGPVRCAGRRVAAGRRLPRLSGVWASFIGGFTSGEVISGADERRSDPFRPARLGVAIVSRPPDPNLEGLGGFFFGAVQALGALTSVAPANSMYRLSFSPCAILGRSRFGQHLRINERPAPVDNSKALDYSTAFL
jgi:hypothetical protein